MFLEFESEFITSKILSLLNFIKFKKHLSTLLLSFPFKYLYLNTLRNDSQYMFVLIPSPTRKTKLHCFFGVSKDFGNNLQTALFLFVMIVYVKFLSGSLQKLVDRFSRAICKYLQITVCDSKFFTLPRSSCQRVKYRYIVLGSIH